MIVATPRQIVNNPAAFAGAFLKILDKHNQLIPFRWNKAQAHFHANRTGRDLILKARQLGFSTHIQGEMFRREVTASRTTITLAHDADTTAKLRLMADRFWEHCRFNDIQPARKYANASLTTYPEFDSTSTIATAGNMETGRGGTYSDFHGSEVAFWKDAERIIAGAMQGGNPDAVLESTPNGAQGYFYELAMEALRGDGVWTLHFYPWWWDAEYIADATGIEYTDEESDLVEKHNLRPEQIAWRRNKQMELKGLFVQEYPEDPVTCFLTSGKSYFGNIAHVWTAPTPAAKHPEHEYVAGLDFGQTNDYTAMVILDNTTKQQVDLIHMRRLPWAEQRSRIVKAYKRWGCKKMGAERNSIGAVNIEALQDEGLTIIPFDTTNESKAGIMSELYEDLHTGGWQLQDHPVQRHEMNTFVSSQLPSGIWRLAADGEGHDDTVIGLGIARWACKRAVALPKAQPKQESKYRQQDTPKYKRY